MALPNLPPFFDMIYNDKDGKLTPNALLYNDEMNTILRALAEQFNELVITAYANNDYTNTGLMVPRVTSAQVAVFAADDAVPVGTIWFVTDLAPSPKLQVKTTLGSPGTIETIQSV